MNIRANCILDPNDVDLASQLGRVLDGKGIDVLLACASARADLSLSYNLSRNLAPFPRLVSIGIDDAEDRDCFDEWPKGMSFSRYRFKREDLLHGKIDILARSVLYSVTKDTVDKDLSLLQRSSVLDDGKFPVLEPDSIQQVDAVDQILQAAKNGVIRGNSILSYRAGSIIRVTEPCLLHRG